MSIRRLRYKLLIVIALTLSLGFIATAWFYSRAAEESIVSENQRSLHKLSESVISILRTVMLDRHAEIMPDYVKRLRTVNGLVSFHILRTDGTDSFVDNRTIDDVNSRQDGQDFPRRKELANPPLIDPAHPPFARAIAGEEALTEVIDGKDGEKLLRLYDPIDNIPKCARCHGSEAGPRGVIQITTSLADVERSINQMRYRTLLLLAVSLLATMLLTGFMLGRAVVRPIETVTEAMGKISAGDFSQRIKIPADDEIGKLATGFNSMTRELQDTYDHMLRERDKLQTVVEGAQNAVIATDAKGDVVIVNKAAEAYLGKTAAEIRAGGILGIFDDQALMERLLAQDDNWETPAARTVSYNGKVFIVSAATICDDAGQTMGSAALLQDVTEEKRLLDELRKLSTTDPLTGLYNRRHLDATLRKEFERFRQSRAPVSVVLFDVDHFKRFNDTYGHDQGDRVLQAVGRWMHQVTRQYDVACRYGGEEFVLILPASTAAAAHGVAERLRQLIEASEVDGLRVTVSLGVACSDMSGLDSAEALIEAADSALYRAKEAGRNRSMVFVADPAA